MEELLEPKKRGYLVLGRKVGESIVLKEMNIVIQVVSVRGGTVRLGFSAPDEVAINREEVYLKKKNPST